MKAVQIDFFTVPSKLGSSEISYRKFYREPFPTKVCDICFNVTKPGFPFSKVVNVLNSCKRIPAFHFSFASPESF